MFVCDLKLQKKTQIIYIIQFGIVWYSLHVDICNLGGGFLATDYMSFLQSPGIQGQTGLVIYIEV